MDKRRFTDTNALRVVPPVALNLYWHLRKEWNDTPYTALKNVLIAINGIIH